MRGLRSLRQAKLVEQNDSPQQNISGLIEEKQDGNLTNTSRVFFGNSLKQHIQKEIKFQVRS
jgi:hypothetical protein